MVATCEIAYEADGRQMLGTLGLPDGLDERPAILICHEGGGLDEYQKGRARQLAELGYVAFALDYHGGGQALPDPAAAMKRLGELSKDSERTRALGVAGLDILLNEPRALASKVAVIGYCFGGAIALELARMGADLKAVVGFHPGLTTTKAAEARNIKAKILVCVGTEDPLIGTFDQRRAFEEEMRAGGVDWRMNLYGGAMHGFTHPFADQAGIPGMKYHEASDRRSWRAMLDLFDEVFA